MALKRSSVRSRSAPPNFYYAAELKLKFNKTANKESEFSHPLILFAIFLFFKSLEKFDSVYKCFDFEEEGDTTKHTKSTCFLSAAP